MLAAGFAAAGFEDTMYDRNVLRPLPIALRVLHATVLVLVLGPGLAAASGELAEPREPAAVDLARYAGTWHEIARIPMFFQRKCVRDVTATYTLREGHVAVLNRCVTAGAETITAAGKAFVTDAPTNRRLEVGFLDILGWMPFKGDYWILALDPEYRWAIVGDRDRRYGWILSRTTELTPALRTAIDARLRGLGYDPAAFSAGSAPYR